MKPDIPFRHFRKLVFGIIFSVILYSCSVPTKSKTVEVKETELIALTSLDRAGQFDALSGPSQVSIKAAKNEYESFQVAVRAVNKPSRVVKIEVSDLKGNAGVISQEHITVFRPEYIKVGRSSPMASLPPGLYLDPLIPFNNPIDGKPIEAKRQIQEYWHGPITTTGYDVFPLPFDLWLGQNQSFWFDVYIPPNTPAGEYKGLVTVTLDNYRGQRKGTQINIANKILSIPVTLTVWDFTLPDKATLRNHFGNISQISQRFGVEPNSDKYRDIEMEYCKIYAEHRLNPPIPHYMMPKMKEDGSLEIIPERHAMLKGFMRDMKVADFEIPHPSIPGLNTLGKEASQEAIEKCKRYFTGYYHYVKENGWDDRAYVYLYDEPNTIEDYQKVRELSAIIHEATPELKVLVVEQTYTQDPSWGTLNGAIDIWCPLLGYIDRDDVNQTLKRGNEVWSYTALSQTAPNYHPNYSKIKDFSPPFWHIDQPVIAYRTPSWINFQYGITGLLYWSMTTTVLNDWYNPGLSLWSTVSNGEGYIIYPGHPCGINGPVSSIRLKNLRESMEDYEYLKIYEQLAGRTAALKLVSQVAAEWWGTTEDAGVLFSTREQIAHEIQKLKNK